MKDTFRDLSARLETLVTQTISSASPVVDALSASLDSSKSFFSEGYQSVSGRLDALRLSSNIAGVPSSSRARFDEKHYFIVPYALTDIGFTLHSTRLLPFAVPPINDLPKRRIFHLPSEDYRAALESLLVQQITEDSEASLHSGTGSSLLSMANAIDRVDNKLTGGLILVGGLVAMANPAFGAGIAAHALIPGIGGKLSKYGLTWSGEKLNKLALNKTVEKARSQVLAQFNDAETVSLENPLLAELQLALATTADQHEPANFDTDMALFERKDNEQYLYMSSKAILEVYAGVEEDRQRLDDLSVGPEDLEWFACLENIVSVYEASMFSQQMHRWHRYYTLLSTRLTQLKNPDLLSRLEDCDENIRSIVPLVSRKKILDSDRYEIERLFFTLLPELIQKYLSVPKELLQEPVESGMASADHYFRESFITLTDKIAQLGRDIYDSDSRSLRLLSQYLQEAYPEKDIEI